MSGKEDYVDNQLNGQIETLERLASSLVLDKINVNPEAEKYLVMREDDINKLTPAELATAEYILSAHSLVVQRKVNRAISIKGWATRCLDIIVARDYNEFDSYMRIEQRKAAVAKNDGFAKRLYDIITQQELIIDDLTYLSQNIHHISNTLGNLARIRSKNYAFSAREN